MAVVTSFFGVTKLTGEDSNKFRQQVSYGRPNQAAKDALARGTKILNAIDNKGCYTVTVKKK